MPIQLAWTSSAYAAKDTMLAQNILTEGVQMDMEMGMQGLIHYAGMPLLHMIESSAHNVQLGRIVLEEDSMNHSAVVAVIADALTATT